MSLKEKYNYWEDRTVDGFVYRYSEYEIKRHPVAGYPHWSVWRIFTTQRACSWAWRELCDKAAEQKAVKETP